MRINSNLSALNTYNQLTKNNFNSSKSMEKLSTGQRINRAADDAAGLSISEKMRAQIKGLERAQANSQDGISMIQTAEGALGETHNILQRMRELAVQSATDTNSTADRNTLQNEMNQLTDEIDRIRNTTEFNTKNLLDGSLAKESDVTARQFGNTALKTSGGAAYVTTSTKLTDLEDTNGNSLNIDSGDKITVNYSIDGKAYSKEISVASGTTLSGLAQSGFGVTIDSGNSGQVNFTSSSGGLSKAITGLTYTVRDSNGEIKANATKALSSMTETQSATDLSNENRAVLQIGANSAQSMLLEIGDMGSSSLGVKDIQITSQENANSAIKAIDDAIAKVSKQRSAIGAVQNRLEFTINNLGTSAENMTAAESRIRDVDMAKEMMTFTKNNILSQAAQSMLAQANQKPQSVLQLLQG